MSILGFTPTPNCAELNYQGIRAGFPLVRRKGSRKKGNCLFIGERNALLCRIEKPKKTAGSVNTCSIVQNKAGTFLTKRDREDRKLYMKIDLGTPKKRSKPGFYQVIAGKVNVLLSDRTKANGTESHQEFLLSLEPGTIIRTVFDNGHETTIEYDGRDAVVL